MGPSLSDSNLCEYDLTESPTSRFSVSTVFIVTSSLIAIQIFYVKGKPIFLSLAFFALFGFVDGLFWSAALEKIPHGAWVPLSIGCTL